MEKLVEEAVGKYDKKVVLKPKQLECLNLLAKDRKDVLVNLPVGYGKSLIYHLLPNILGQKNDISRPCVLVVSPLNIIQEDQLRALKQHNIPACKLDIKMKVDVLDDDDDEKDDVDSVSGGFKRTYQFQSASSLADIESGKFQVVLCHPEAILNTMEGVDLLNSVQLQKHVVAVVIDECHIIEEWGKEFRTAFSKLHCLAAFFPKVPIIGLSGTLTVELLKKMPGMLGQVKPVVIQETPDRPNIVLEKKHKISSNDSAAIYEHIYKPECDKLFNTREKYPVTLMYIPMSYMSQALSYLRRLMGEQDIHSSIYSAIFSNQDADVMKVTTSELKKKDPRIRLVLSTSVSGMGFDPENVTQIIHSKPPRNLSQYLQEVGRAGRRGQKSFAVLYYNNNDIAKNLPGIKDNIIDYCKNDQKCLREQMLSGFGFEKPDIDGCSCCSYCRSTCSCSSCSLSGLEEEFFTELSFHE